MLKKFLFFIIISFYSNILLASNHLASENDMILIDDLPGHFIKKVVFFVGDLSIIETHKNLIKALNTSIFLVLVSSDLLKYKQQILIAYDLPNTTVKFSEHPLTSWTQDRLLRSNLQVYGVFSDHTNDSYSLYETVSVDEINDFFKFKSSNKYLENLYISKFTGKDPIITSIVNNKFYHVSKSSLFYGDGGDRLITNNFIFLGGNTFNQIKSLNIEKIHLITNKEIINIDTDNLNRYAFHLDLFLTFLNDKNVIFGSYELALQKLPSNLNWVDYSFMQKKIEIEKIIILQLKLLGFNVIKIPLIYKKDWGFISFNNGVFNNNTFYLSQFNFKNIEIDNILTDIQNDIQNTFNQNGILLKFIEGGENNIKLGGQVRCTTAIIDY